MSITLSTTYKEVLPAKIVELIDNLVDDGNDLEDLLTTLDYFGEEYYENFEEIVECLNDTGVCYTYTDLYDFVKEHGVDNLEHFEKYSELLDNYDSAAVDAFISLYNMSDLKQFEDVYRGYFSNVRDFVEDYIESMGETIPCWICVDHEATWESSLRFDYNEENGYYFDSNW